MTERTRQEFGFARTICGCEQCSINCRFIPGYLIPADLDRVAERIGSQNLQAYAQLYLLASPGATVILTSGEPLQIPTLVPARRPDGACTFLSAGNRCTIHEVSPFGCAFFDSHQSREESDQRSMHGLYEIARNWRDGGLYAQLWLALDAAGRVAPPPMVARVKMKAAMSAAMHQGHQGS